MISVLLCPCCGAAVSCGAVLVPLGLGLPVHVELCGECGCQFQDKGDHYAIYVEGRKPEAKPETWR